MRESTEQPAILQDPLAPTASLQGHEQAIATPPLSPAEIRRYVRAHYAFGLPAGSVRALLAMVTFGGIWAWMWLHPDAEVPAYFRDLMFIIMGHYFAARHHAGSAEIGPPPLYLPRGTVRTLLIAGFVTLTIGLLSQHRMSVHDTTAGGAVRLSHAGVMLILVAGFMLGVLVAKLGGRGVPRWVEDLRATVSLTAGVLLLLLVFGLVHVSDAGPMHTFQRWALHYRIEDVLAAVVGFYFGSKS